MRGQGLGPKIIKKLLKRLLKIWDYTELNQVFLPLINQLLKVTKDWIYKRRRKRDFRKLNGEYYNLWQMSMLESEWS